MQLIMTPSDWLALTPGRSVELPHSAVSDVDQVVLAAPEPVISETPEMNCKFRNVEIIVESSQLTVSPLCVCPCVFVHHAAPRLPLTALQ